MNTQQKKKLAALNKLLNEVSQYIEEVTNFQTECNVLDKIVSDFNQLHPLPNLKAEIEDEHSEEGMEPDEYYFHSDFGPKAPGSHFFRSTLNLSEKKRKQYFDTLSNNKQFIINSMNQFEAFLFDNYNIELSSAKKRITENTNYTQKHFFIKECKYPICVYINLSNPSISFSLMSNKYDSNLVKEFKKSTLDSFYEKKAIESSLKEIIDVVNIKKKIKKI